MKQKIDLIDKKILLELDKNSRQSFSQLARKLHISKGTVNYRIKQLETKGLIQGYYSVIDTVKLGYYNFRVYIKLKETSKKEKEDLVNYLAKSKRTWWIALTTFPYDIAVIFLAKDMHEFDSIFKDFLRKYKPNLQSYQVKVYLELKHFFREYILFEEQLEKRDFMILGEEKKVELTPQELAVLKELSTNARIETIVLAKKLKMSPLTAKSIIKRLTKIGVIKCFRVLMDYTALDYEYYWVHINVSDFAKGQKLGSFIEMFPETVYRDETIGGSDIEFAVQISKEKGIQNMLTVIFDNFNDIITDYNYFKVLENKKVGYMPQE